MVENMDMSKDFQQDIADNYGGFKQETIIGTYDDLADRYEEMMLGMGH